MMAKMMQHLQGRVGGEYLARGGALLGWGSTKGKGAWADAEAAAAAVDSLSPRTDNPFARLADQQQQQRQQQQQQRRSTPGGGQPLPQLPLSPPSLQQQQHQQQQQGQNVPGGMAPGGGVGRGPAAATSASALAAEGQPCRQNQQRQQPRHRVAGEGVDVQGGAAPFRIGASVPACTLPTSSVARASLACQSRWLERHSRPTGSCALTTRLQWQIPDHLAPWAHQGRDHMAPVANP